MELVEAQYKQTEVGLIPEDWEVESFGDLVFSIASGKSNTKNELGNYPIYGSTGIIGYKSYSDYSGNALLVARVGANAGNIYTTKGEYCVSDNTLIIKVGRGLDFDYTFYGLKYFNLNRLVFGSGQPLVTGGQLKSITIPLPPLHEQQAIAQVLSDTDKLIQSLEKKIAKKKLIKQGVMQQLLTPKEGWEVKKLGEIANITKLAGFEYSNYFNSYKDKGEIVVLRGTNITGNRLNLSDVKTIPRKTSDFLKRSKLYKGDLVFAYVGTIGPVYLVKEDNRFHLGPNTSKISAGNSLSPEFLFHYFTSWLIQNEIVEHTSIGAQPSLSMTKIRSFNINLPSLEEQVDIASALTAISNEIKQMTESLRKYNLLKQGMMQQLLTGKIRLNTMMQDDTR